MIKHIFIVSKSIKMTYTHKNYVNLVGLKKQQEKLDGL